MIARALAAARARAASVIVLVAAAGCSREVLLGSDVSPTGGAGGFAGTAGTGVLAGSANEGGGEASETGGSGGTGCSVASCRGAVYACGDCKDNDGDGKIDAEDPECTGPCDDREDSLDVGLPGSGSQACQEDCFFDRGAGPGNDGCRFSARCDPLSVAPDYPPSGQAACAYDEATKLPGGASCADARAEQASSCAEVCGPLTPNGCDCFGCCELPAGSGGYVFLGTGLPCKPVDSCLNPCDACESCVGRPDPLPSCGTSIPACLDAYRPCDPTQRPLCPLGSYCITGCCVPQPR